VSRSQPSNIVVVIVEEIGSQPSEIVGRKEKKKKVTIHSNCQIEWADCLETLTTRPLLLLLQQGPQAQHTIACLRQIHNLCVAYTAPLAALATFVHSSKLALSQVSSSQDSD